MKTHKYTSRNQCNPQVSSSVVKLMKTCKILSFQLERNSHTLLPASAPIGTNSKHNINTINSLMLQNSDNKPLLTSISAIIYCLKFFRGLTLCLTQIAVEI
jgi:hypothetical protein